MKKVAQIFNKKRESLIHFSARWYTGRSGHAFALAFFAFVTFVIGGTVFAPTAAAHSDLDPDIEEITQRLTETPDRVDLLLKRGQLYRFNGKLNESLNDLEHAWLLDRTNQKVALERSYTLSALGHDTEAEAVLNDLLKQELGGKRVFALVARAHILERTGRAELAIADFSSAIRLYPTVELYLARGHLQESLGKLKEADSGYQEGLTKLNHATILRKELIRVKIAQKQYKDALALIDQEAASSSGKTEWYMRRADILTAMGQTAASKLAKEKALEEANRTLARRPTAIHLMARAKVHYAMGDQEAAKRDLRMAVNKAPRFTEASDFLQKLEAQ